MGGRKSFFKQLAVNTFLLTKFESHQATQFVFLVAYATAYACAFSLILVSLTSVYESFCWLAVLANKHCSIQLAASV
jgi:hypothetical protein